MNEFLFHLGKYLGVGLLDAVLGAILALQETAKLFCKVSVLV